MHNLLYFMDYIFYDNVEFTVITKSYRIAFRNTGYKEPISSIKVDKLEQMLRTMKHRGLFITKDVYFLNYTRVVAQDVYR